MLTESIAKKRFRISKKAAITEAFTCRLYPDLQPIPYKVCLGRQLAKTRRGEFLYPECPECPDGQKIAKHFKDWKPEKKLRPNWNSMGVVENMQKLKKKTHSNSTEKPTEKSVAKQLLLLRAQLDYLAELLHMGRMQEAAARLKLITDALKEA